MSLHHCPSCQCDSDAARRLIAELGRQRVPTYKIAKISRLSVRTVKLYLRRAGITPRSRRGRLHIEEVLQPQDEARVRETWAKTQNVRAVAKIIGYVPETTRRYLRRIGLMAPARQRKKAGGL